jgi:Pyruvate/2-oxoacid:ferredoxin oxidoreductase delta subunit
MTARDIYQKLGEHLSLLGMGYPLREDLIEILKENFSPREAEVALALPNKVIPLAPTDPHDIQTRVPSLSKEELMEILENLSRKGLLYCGKTEEGERGYALQQVGFGFPQTFFWKGEDTPHARKMAGMVAKYFNRKVTREAYSSKTKPYRYIPIARGLGSDMQAVYPHHMMERVIRQAQVIAVAHCPCRVSYTLAGRGCQHPTEVCMKFNDMARYTIERGFAREVTQGEAFGILKVTEEAGLVHFVDNAEEDIQHNCNCCGCACWNVGNIRRRKIPRDVLMETYFIRVTDEDQCTGCGACKEICPVDAIVMEEDVPRVDREWCIGCGVCSTVCPSGAAKIEVRPEKSAKLPAGDFKGLHNRILEEKGLTKTGGLS